jgi:hypothetical protein
MSRTVVSWNPHDGQLAYVQALLGPSWAVGLVGVRVPTLAVEEKATRCQVRRSLCSRQVVSSE